jgi:hypothetical protein
MEKKKIQNPFAFKPHKFNYVPKLDFFKIERQSNVILYHEIYLDKKCNQMIFWATLACTYS